MTVAGRSSDVGSGEVGWGPWRTGALDGFVPFPDDAVEGSVAARFEQVAATAPESVALRSPAGNWTYGDLSRTVAGRAGGLTGRLGDHAPEPVAVLMAHDGPLVATILAVLWAGHLVVVLDPMAPDVDVDHAVAESGASLLVHDEEFAARAGTIATGAPHAMATVRADDLDGERRPPVVRGAQDPCMLAFTSGTSGSSKAGVITNGVLLNLVRGASNALGIGAHDRMPMLFPTSMAVAAYPLFLPLLNGGTLSTLDVRSVGLAPIGDFLVDERITVAYLAPTVVRFLEDALAGRTFPDLRLVALGGELVDPDVVALTRRLFEPEYLANGYGTTETGVVALHVLGASDVPERAVPVGHPVAGVEISLLDDEGNEVPPGEPGEVAVSSPHLFLGYWGHPELNRQVIEEDPARGTSWRRYRTGDFGRIDEHGCLVVDGRLDAKVKVRGRFVVLGDVEASIHARPEVADAAVAAHTVGGITELVAYVVPADPGGFDPTGLRAELLETLDGFKVPPRWVVLDELPRLPNGKTDRRALPSPTAVGGSVAGADPNAATVTPVDVDTRDALRATVRDLWEHLLPVGVIGLDEDFFHLGGDSLLAAQMLVALEQATGVIVPMGDLVHARTVREVSEAVLRHRVQPSSTVSVVQVGREDRPRLWFVHDLQGSAYRVRHLAAHLGDDQPVWSFESPLLRGEPNRFSTLDTFAANYLTDLRAAQPEGPYWLAGYSFGGICAYEMARQLRRDGQEVAFVGIVDVGPGFRGPGWHEHRSPARPWFGVRKPPEPGTGVVGSVRYYREMLRESPAALLRHLSVRCGVARYVDPVRFRLDLRRDGVVRPQWRLWYAWEQHWRLAAVHWNRSHSYAGSVDLFWADETASADASMGWKPLVGELDIHRFAGNHHSLLEPTGAPALGSSLREVLDARLAARGLSGES